MNKTYLTVNHTQAQLKKLTVALILPTGARVPLHQTASYGQIGTIYIVRPKTLSNLSDTYAVHPVIEREIDSFNPVIE
ncbi:hypothetical protein NECAME_00233 [Necator americanus]|uniref:Uncharacterized protein n=1 Tax=Necator americanus TaxID=51031 RepID=W2TJB4_NECAM|nr:hypothetical protein NECAME_00233 [Necator americanus]ETN81883.1 hypothetical protein NECAME_00233 [Necator americanus]